MSPLHVSVVAGFPPQHRLIRISALLPQPASPPPLLLHPPPPPTSIDSTEARSWEYRLQALVHCSVFSRKLWRDELAKLRRVLPGGRTNACIIALARMWGSSCIPVYVLALTSLLQGAALTAYRGVTRCPLSLQVASGHFPIRSVVFQGAGPIRQSDEVGPAPYPCGTAEPPCCPLPTPPLPLHAPRWWASEPVHNVQGPGGLGPTAFPLGSH